MGNQLQLLLALVGRTWTYIARKRCEQQKGTLTISSEFRNMRVKNRFELTYGKYP